VNLSQRKGKNTAHKHTHISKGNIQQKRNIGKMHKLQIEHRIIPTATKIQKYHMMSTMEHRNISYIVYWLIPNLTV
jgi:hypothetical protein